jgi:hypothetical protein
VFLDDAFQHLRFTGMIPYSLRVYHSNRSLFTDAQAVRFSTIDASRSIEIKFFKPLFKVFLGFEAELLFTAFGLSLISTQKNVSFYFIDVQFFGFSANAFIHM